MIIIYGKDGCSDCAKAKMLCDMQSRKYSYKLLDKDYSAQELNNLVGHEVRSLPQIFKLEDNKQTHLGGYSELRKDKP